MFPSLRRVMLVDDDDISLFLISTFLRQKQIAETVLPFSNGRNALEYLANNATNFSGLPELILLDIKMPGISGWQFLEELKRIEFADGYEPAVCIVSAEPTIDIDILRNWHCIKGYLLKPIILKNFIAVIESIAARIELNNAPSYDAAPVTMTA